MKTYIMSIHPPSESDIIDLTVEELKKQLDRITVLYRKLNRTEFTISFVGVDETKTITYKFYSAEKRAAAYTILQPIPECFSVSMTEIEQ